MHSEDPSGLALPTEPETAIELFAGAAGLCLGLKLAVPSCRTVCYVEQEAYAAALLVARMEAADLDPAPVWDDVATFDGKPWRGRVDLVAGGFPCTDISHANQSGRGLDGDRSGLWRHFARIVDEVRPGRVFVENVAHLVTKDDGEHLRRVLGDLDRLGYTGAAIVVRVADVGAPHGRARVFIMAHAYGRRLDRERSGRLLDSEREALGLHAHGRSGTGVHVWPPNPDDRDGWGAIVAARPDLEPQVYRMAHGLADRVDGLRLTGNGVVPAQAAAAWRLLSFHLFG